MASLKRFRLNFLIVFVFLGGFVGEVVKAMERSESVGDSIQLTTDGETEAVPPTTQETTPTPFPSIYQLDYEWNPEEEKTIHSTSTSSYKFELAPNSTGYRIAVHLKSCDYGGKDNLRLYIPELNKTVEWSCNTKSSSSSNSHDMGVKHHGDKYITVKAYLDNLTEVWITPNFSSTHSIMAKRDVAKIVINLYQDIASGNSCPEDFFDCYQPLCPEKCCSEGDAISGFGGRGGKQITSKKTSILSPRSSVQSRCIPEVLKCNGRPNCGMHTNRDEQNEICHPANACPCKRMCLTWNYVLTSLAIAVLFIITPTAIVFALFHRRNVALERARLVRLAQQRMADMRGEFTRESPANDLPPTYDDVYDIKVPPPCFCKALAMEMGVEATDQSENLTENETDETGNTTEGTNENLGFTCSCSDLTKSEELPPSYSDVDEASESSNSTNSNSRIVTISRGVEDPNESSDFEIIAK